MTDLGKANDESLSAITRLYHALRYIERLTEAAAINRDTSISRGIRLSAAHRELTRRMGLIHALSGRLNEVLLEKGRDERRSINIRMFGISIFVGYRRHY